MFSYCLPGARDPRSSPNWSLTILGFSSCSSLWCWSVQKVQLGCVTCERPETFILLSSVWSGAIEAGQVNDSRQLLKDIFNCNYEAGSGGSKLLWFLKTDLYADWVLHNDFLRTACMKDPWLCYSPDFVSASCQAHPIRLIKTVRMRLYQVHQLLRDPG